jgi:hypothetical protein
VKEKRVGTCATRETEELCALAPMGVKGGSVVSGFDEERSS